MEKTKTLTFQCQCRLSNLLTVVSLVATGYCVAWVRKTVLQSEKWDTTSHQANVAKAHPWPLIPIAVGGNGCAFTCPGFPAPESAKLACASFLYRNHFALGCSTRETFAARISRRTDLGFVCAAVTHSGFVCAAVTLSQVRAVLVDCCGRGWLS
jgi:hypothetical protein